MGVFNVYTPLSLYDHIHCIQLRSSIETTFPTSIHYILIGD